MTTVTDDVDGFDDVWMFESGTDAKFCGDLLLILLLGLTRSFGPKLLDGKDITTMFPLDQSDGTSGTRTENSAPLAVLLSEMSLCGLGEGRDRVGGRFTDS